MSHDGRGPLPLLALTVGDPAGIGPEICLLALESEAVRDAARVLALGPAALRPASVPLLSSPAELDHFGWIDTGTDGDWTPGRPQASGGDAALRALRRGAALAHVGGVDALVTGPVSKEALHLAGEEVEGQTQLLARWADAERVQMLAVAGELRVLLLTRHLPLREALDAITTERVLDHLRLLHGGLERFGFTRPRLALAGLNPHAGEAGLLGSEERELLAPAVAAARDEGIDVAGPLSPDSVFLRAKDGAYDGVLALYHDQGLIAAKLAAPRRSVTVLLGLPYLRVSPAHGTAFDVVGTGAADPTNLIEALRQAAAWSRSRA